MKRSLSAIAAILLSSILPKPAAAVGPWPLFLAYQTKGCAGDSIAAGDFNTDGHTDVAVVTESQLCIFYQNPTTGVLSAPTVISLPSGTYRDQIAAGDLNGDGRDDIVATHRVNTLLLWLQDNAGSLYLSQTLTTDTDPDALGVADVNGDGRKDVIVSHWNAATIGVYYQKESGGLNERTTYPSIQAGWDDIDAGDLDGDSRIDAVKMNGQGLTPALMVYTQTSSHTLSSPVSYAGSPVPGGIGVGDVTGDGRDDVVMSYGGNSPSSKIAVYRQTETGVLSSPVSYNAYDIPGPIVVADVTMDGRKDVIVLHNGWMRAGVFRQNTDGTLVPEELYSIPYASWYTPHGLDIADVNSDGLPDLLVEDYNYGLSVLYHSTGDLSLTGTQSATTVLPSRPVTFTLQVQNTGPFTTTQVVLTDSLPSGASLVSASSTQGSCSGAVNISCQLNTLSVGALVTVTLVANMPAYATVGSNTADVQTLGDANTANNHLQHQIRTGYPPTFLPLISTSCRGLYGQVSDHGNSAQGVLLALRFYNGANWQTLMNKYTDAAGRYCFEGLGSLLPGQSYYIKYSAQGTYSNRLSSWATRLLTSYSAPTPEYMGSFDVADISLQSPSSGTIVSLPQQFTWIRRPVLSDSHEFNMFNPENPTFLSSTDPLGYVDGFTLTMLPAGFAANVPYGWFVGARSPDGGYGVSYYYRTVTFSSSGPIGSGSSAMKKSTQRVPQDGFQVPTMRKR